MANGSQKNKFLMNPKQNAAIKAMVEPARSNTVGFLHTFIYQYSLRFKFAYDEYSNYKKDT